MKTPNYRIYDRTGGQVTEDIFAESLEDAIEQGREWILGGEWGDYQGTLDCEVGPIIRDANGDIDKDATEGHPDNHADCSAVVTAEDPECEESKDEEHDWQSPYSVVGGCKENPGVWGSGHGTIKSTDVCSHCGIYRTTDYGATDSSNGQQITRVTFNEADEKSLAWLKEA